MGKLAPEVDFKSPNDNPAPGFINGGQQSGLRRHQERKSLIPREMSERRKANPQPDHKEVTGGKHQSSAICYQKTRLELHEDHWQEGQSV